MSEEKPTAEDTDELRPAGEDARVAESHQQMKRIDEDVDSEADAEEDDSEGADEARPDSPLAGDPGEEDTGAQS